MLSSLTRTPRGFAREPFLFSARKQRPRADEEHAASRPCRPLDHQSTIADRSAAYLFNVSRMLSLDDLIRPEFAPEALQR
jgi:hypothetical protein